MSEPVTADVTIEHIRDRGLRYTPYYCEENIWHLCDEPGLAAADRRVVFISSPARRCAMWGQRAAPRRGEPVLWDYHVVLLVRGQDGWVVWDLDTVLGLPLPAGTWLARSFLPLRDEYRHLAPRFRLIDASEYRSQFSSDRSHMRTDTGDWLMPPPPWPAIIVPGAPSFLAWTRMDDRDALTPAQLIELTRRH